MKLRDLTTAQLDTIDFNSYYLQLEMIPVDPRLSSVATELDTLANEVLLDNILALSLCL